MEEFDLAAALVSGFAATVVMSVVMRGAKAVGMTEMPMFPIMMGSMFTGDPTKARIAGAMVHFVMMGTVVFGVIYAALFNAFDTVDWWAGLLIGVAHGLVVGTMMPAMPMVHPRLERERELAGVDGRGGEVIVHDAAGEVHIRAPGFFGVNWGPMTPVGVVMGHAIYGVVLALVYNAIV